MPVWILTGPPGVGKNTVATALARRRPRCAIVDVDLVRWMVVQPHHPPWDGSEGEAQQFLGVMNACLLARNFVAADYDVALLDVLTDVTAQRYRAQLQDCSPKIVLLMASLEEVQRRNHERGLRLTTNELPMLYRQQHDLATYDIRIDTTDLPAPSPAHSLVSLAASHYADPYQQCTFTPKGHRDVRLPPR